MDTIGLAISSRRARRQRLVDDLRELDDEIAALIKVYQILGGEMPTEESAKRANAPSTSRGGKPAGSISAKWQGILANLLPVGSMHTLTDVHFISQVCEAGLNVTSVRDRLRSMIETGYVIKHDDGRFSVTPTFAERYNLPKDASPLVMGGTSEYRQKIEPPSA